MPRTAPRQAAPHAKHAHAVANHPAMSRMTLRQKANHPTCRPMLQPSTHAMPHACSPYVHAITVTMPACMASPHGSQLPRARPRQATSTTCMASLRSTTHHPHAAAYPALAHSLLAQPADHPASRPHSSTSQQLPTNMASLRALARPMLLQSLRQCPYPAQSTCTLSPAAPTKHSTPRSATERTYRPLGDLSL